MRKILVIMMIAVLVACSANAQTNKVLSLDGDGDYLLLGKRDAFDIVTLTMEFWFNITVFDDQAILIWNGDTTGGKDPFVLKTDDGKLFHLVLIFDIGAIGLQAQVNSYGYHHIAFAVDDNTKTACLYLDGTLVDTGDFTGWASISEYNHLAIGAYADGGGVLHGMTGFIDDVRLWNIVRSQEQIQATMNATLGGFETGLVGYWNFDNGTANDLTANVNDGTLFGDAKIVNQFYVSPSGNDANDGSKANPFGTIQYAIDQSGRSDVITALPGIYEENITLVSDLVVQGSGVDTTIITASSGDVVTANNVHNVLLSGFTIDGQGTADNGIWCSGSTSETEIRNNVVTSATQGIGCTDSVNVNLNRNIIDNNSDGIMCRSDATVSIIENVIQQNTHDGIDSWNTVDLIIQNNTISENINAGAVFNDNSVVIVIKNAVQNNGHGFWCAGDVTVTISDNLIHHNRMSGISMSSSKIAITRNIIYSNVWFDIGCYEGSDSAIVGGKLTNANNFVDNNGIAIQNYTPSAINATYNYWGTDDESEIENMMHNEGDGLINFKPFIGDPELIGNVSGTGGITAFDASLILQYVVGLIDQFPANTTSIGENVIPRNRTISIPNLAIKVNESISVPVVIDETADLVAGGITISFDQTLLRPIGVMSNIDGAFFQSKIYDDKIRFAFVSTENSSNTEILATVAFETIGDMAGMTTGLIIDHAQIAESLSIKRIDGSIVFLPSKTVLLQNYPNPFNPETWIPFYLADDAAVVISIYDVGGQLVRKIDLGDMPAGVYVGKDKAIYWDGSNDAGEKVSSGLYFYQLQAGDYTATKRMLILK